MNRKLNREAVVSGYQTSKAVYGQVQYAAQTATKVGRVIHHRWVTRPLKVPVSSMTSYPSHPDNVSHLVGQVPFPPDVVWEETDASECLISFSPEESTPPILPKLSADWLDSIKEELHRAGEEELPGKIAVFDDPGEFDPLGDSFSTTNPKRRTTTESHQRARLRREWESLPERVHWANYQVLQAGTCDNEA